VTDSVYLDYASTAPLRREVLEAMFPYFQQTFGNPSSVHSVGAQSAAALAKARAQIADVLGCLDDEIIFTSGGTESDNLALIGAAEAGRVRGNHVVVSAIEHEAIVKSAEALSRRGFVVSIAPVDRFGLVDADALASLVRSETTIVSCMFANNEIGTIQPITDLSDRVHALNPRTAVHTDAVQAAATLELNVDRLRVDLLSISAHKLGGPRGVGALYVRRGVTLEPILYGGGQERGRRSGTENVAGIVGMAEALLLAQRERDPEAVRLAGLRDVLTKAVLSTGSGVRLTGHPIRRLAGHASFVLRDRTAESVLVDLDVRGVLCSSGSACHAGQTDPSHVLLAIGEDNASARNGLRMTLGSETDEDDIHRAIAVIHSVLAASSNAVVSGAA
jgi:cysteine desulfurase